MAKYSLALLSLFGVLAVGCSNNSSTLKQEDVSSSNLSTSSTATQESVSPETETNTTRPLAQLGLIPSAAKLPRPPGMLARPNG